MVITCPNCDAKYSIDKSSLKGKGARATCKSCKTVFPIYLENPEEKKEEKPEELQLPSLDELDVFALNFKEVGLKSWKVKIKMGLVYDFSDYKTLSKYIREGKVATTDNLSSDDGKSWTPLNEIADLEKHFCEVYLQKKKAMLEGGEPEPVETKKTPPKSSPTPVLGSGLSDLASVLAEAEAEVDGRPTPRNRPQKRTKPPAKKSASKKKASEKTEEPKKGNNIFVLLLLMLAVSGGVLFYMQQQAKNAKQQREEFQEKQLTQPTAQDKKEDEARQKSLEEKMEKLRRERAAKKQKEEEKEREEKEPEIVQTEEERQILARLEQQEKAQSVATNSVEDGKNAIRSQKWKKAEKIFREVISSQPTPGNKVLLGQVLFKQQKFSEARNLLQQAKGLPEAHKWLGFIAKEEGDDAGANQHFSVYLQSNPSDASQIKGVMNGN